MNLYEEIIKLLKANGKNKEDVIWAGNETFKIPLSKFWEIANTEYDNGYGLQEVAVDLIIVGNSFWLERNDYDGAEWFEYKEYPKMPSTEIDIDCLTVNQHSKKYDSELFGGEDLFSLNNINMDNNIE